MSGLEDAIANRFGLFDRRTVDEVGEQEEALDGEDILSRGVFEPVIEGSDIEEDDDDDNAEEEATVLDIIFGLGSLRETLFFMGISVVLFASFSRRNWVL